MINFSYFSKKQLAVLNWWCKNKKTSSFDAIICDGSIRSGKTTCMSLSFILWTFYNFNSQYFAFCGKSKESVCRNIIHPLINFLPSIGFKCDFKSSKNILTLSLNNQSNHFYIFSGKDESSASFIQGVTLAGVMFDEVALMPHSFVEQAIARCSVIGSKFWFNCNPDNPSHWFYTEWIKKSKQKNALYVHFSMKDNPSLSSEMIKRYSSLYSGHFYQRFILGKWVVSSGTVYSMFDPNTHTTSNPPNHFSQYYISCDYGIINPASFGLWGLHNGVWYRIKEFYFDSKANNYCKTDEQYYQDLLTLASNLPISSIIIDPSASSFIQLIKNKGVFNITLAKNDVVTGIRNVISALNSNKIMISNSCHDCIREFSLYSWKQGKSSDSVIKANDHAMDDLRYFVNTVIFNNPHKPQDFLAYSVLR